MPDRPTASALAEIASSDAFFTVAQRPSLRTGMSAFPLDAAAHPAAVAIDTGTQRLLLRGVNVTAALGALLPLLDGHRDTAQLAAASGLPPSTVQTLLATLTVHGLLQDGHTPPDPRVSVGTWRYISRGVAATGVHQSATDALDVLHATRLTIDGDHALAAALARSLSASGIVAQTAPPVPHPPRELVVTCARPDAATWKSYQDTGRAVLPVIPLADGVIVGPFLEPDATRPCSRCAAAALTALVGDGTPTEDTALAAVTALAATEVAHAIGRFGRTVTNALAVRHDLRAWRTDRYPIVSDPACRACHPQPAPVTPTATAVVRAYESAAGLPDIRWLDPALHREHYRPSALAAQRAFQRASGAARPGTGPLSEIVRRCAGLRDTSATPDRFAPSAGNLGAIVAYAVTADGAHQYDPWHHEWITITGAVTGHPADGVRAAGTGGAVVAFSADLTKLGPKYGLKAYRLAWLEAGAAIAQLAVAAAEFGLGAATLTSWPEGEWATLLDLRARGELLCALAVVGEPA